MKGGERKGVVDEVTRGEDRGGGGGEERGNGWWRR